MRQSRGLIAVVVAVAAGGVSEMGCESPLATEDIRVRLYAGAGPQTIYVTAGFFDARVPGSLPVDLREDDEVTASFRGHDIPMFVNDPGESPGRSLVVTPLLDLEHPIELGETVSVQIRRAGFEDVTITTTLPQNIVIDPFDHVPSTGDLIATWSPVDDTEITWELDDSGGCIPLVDGVVDEPRSGTVMISMPQVGTHPGTNCTAFLALTRSATSFDAAPFASGSLFRAETSNSARFGLTP